jgi:hypothetical protein
MVQQEYSIVKLMEEYNKLFMKQKSKNKQKELALQVLSGYHRQFSSYKKEILSGSKYL